MASPRSKDARLFYRCAFQRFEDAQLLFRNERSTGAVYLAGYGVECILKALILSVVAPKNVGAILGSFKGHRAHDYEWLRSVYRQNGGASLPRETNRCFTLVDIWSTEIRYYPGTVKERDADRFITAAWALLEWADGRL
jgi:HEPN domain-containing protein